MFSLKIEVTIPYYISIIELPLNLIYIYRIRFLVGNTKYFIQYFERQNYTIVEQRMIPHAFPHSFITKCNQILQIDKKIQTNITFGINR